MSKFGEDWKEEVDDANSTDIQVQARIEERKANTFHPPAWANNVVLYAALIAFVVILFGVFANSGNYTAGGSARSMVFVFEGFKGTVFDQVVMQSNKAPNLKRLISGHGGKYAKCNSPHDERCALAQSGARLGGDYKWGSAPGVASILSGVNAHKHKVHNDSYRAMSKYSASSDEYPSFLKVASDAGLRTAVVGSSHLLTTTNGDSGRCDAFGVLDFECGTESVVKCLRADSCNAKKRIAVSKQTHGTNAVEAAFPELESIFEEGADIVVVHIPRLAEIGVTTGDFTATSQQYVAQIYLLDAYIGQVLALLDERIERLHESWLVVGAGDHGGYAKSFGTTMGEDEVVPFFVSSVVPGGKLLFNELTIPTRQYDVAPTILKWHDLLTEELAEKMDGRIQAICSSGKIPVSCGLPTTTSATTRHHKKESLKADR